MSNVACYWYQVSPNTDLVRGVIRLVVHAKPVAVDGLV